MYRIFRLNGVRYSETYLYIKISLLGFENEINAGRRPGHRQSKKILGNLNGDSVIAIIHRPGKFKVRHGNLNLHKNVLPCGSPWAGWDQCFNQILRSLLRLHDFKLSRLWVWENEIGLACFTQNSRSWIQKQHKAKNCVRQEHSRPAQWLRMASEYIRPAQWLVGDGIKIYTACARIGDGLKLIRPAQGLGMASNYMQPAQGLGMASKYIQPAQGLRMASKYTQPAHWLRMASKYTQPAHWLGMASKYTQLVQFLGLLYLNDGIKLCTANCISGTVVSELYPWTACTRYTISPLIFNFSKTAYYSQGGGIIYMIEIDIRSEN